MVNVSLGPTDPGRAERGTPPLARIVLLIACVLACMAQSGDALRVRAAICQNKTCTERARVAFAPATVNVQVYIAQHPGNRALVYGLFCDGIEVSETRAQVDGDADPPLFIRNYKEIGPGECQAVAILQRADGSRHTARSEPLILQARD